MWSVEESRALAVAVDNLPYRDVPAAIEAIHLEGAKESPSIEALPENVQAALPALVAAGGFNPSQARVPKGNDDGGQWVGTAGELADGLQRTPDLGGVGGVVKEQGGASIHPITLEQPSDGYQVGIKGYTKIIPEDVFFGEGGEDALYQWIEDHQEQLAAEGAHIGIWHDTETGNVVLDVSQNVKDRDEAIRMGQEGDQVSIWDNEAGDEIQTGGSGEGLRSSGSTLSSERRLSYDRSNDDATRGQAAARRAAGGLRGPSRGGEAGVRPAGDRGSEASQLTAAASFNPSQARVPKGNQNGGEWVDTVSGVLSDLEDVPIRGQGTMTRPWNGPRLTPKGPFDADAANDLGEPGPSRTYGEMGADPDALVSEVNPGRDTTWGEDYRYNCARTATAMEMRARGYDVVAPGSNGQDATNGSIQDQWMLTIPGPDGSTTPQFTQPSVPGREIGSVIGGVENAGKRYIMSGSFPGYGGFVGHAWNAEVQPDGSVLYFDGQGASLKDRVIDIDKMEKVTALRVDNASPVGGMWAKPDYDTDPYAPPPWIMTSEDFAADYELNYEEELTASVVFFDEELLNGALLVDDGSGPHWVHHLDIDAQTMGGA